MNKQVNNMLLVRNILNIKNTQVESTRVKQLGNASFRQKSQGGLIYISENIVIFNKDYYKEIKAYFIKIFYKDKKGTIMRKTMIINLYAPDKIYKIHKIKQKKKTNEGRIYKCAIKPVF